MPGKFAYIRHFLRIRISAAKFEKTLIDVFAAVAVVDANTPFFSKMNETAVTQLL